MLTFGAIVLTLGLVIFVHELGHFLAAKLTGTGAPRFSIGFGPPTPLRWHWKGTEFIVAWFPLGGYVKLATREEDDPTTAIEGQVAADYPEHMLFERKPLAARAFILSAGVLMNVLLAWVLHAGVLMAVGARTVPVTRITVRPDALPIEARALADAHGATVLRINGDTVRGWDDLTAGIVDPASDRARFEFADRPPVVVPFSTPGTREALMRAVGPWVAPTLGEVPALGPAGVAGLRPGDRVLAVDGDSTPTWDAMVELVRPRAGDTVRVAVARGDSAREFLVPVERHATRLDNRDTVIGRVQVGVALPVEHAAVGPLAAVAGGARATIGDLGLVVATIRGLAARNVSPRELGGPIAIAQLSGQMARRGLATLLTFIAFISVNLAVFNLLPIPVLDGGHLVFLAAEGVRGRPLSLETRYRFMQVGMTFLLLLVVFVFYNDIRRLFGI